MAKRFYVVPKDGDGTNDSPFRPKYIDDAGLGYSAMDYGLEDTFLVACEVSDAQHTLLASQLDVIAIPAELDGLIGLPALATVQSKLEGLHIPADWVTTNHTYRDVIRLTGKLFLFMQRFHGTFLRKFFLAVNLDTRINQLSQTQKTELLDVAASLGIDTSSVTQSMTLRRALKLLADQLPAFVLRGETF